jgi:cytochrome c556
MKPRALTFMLAAGATLAPAAAHDTGGDQVIHYRQSVYRLILWNWTPLSDMIRGEQGFDAAEFARRAERVAWLARQLDEAYQGGPHEGAMTEALPAIWENWADFSAKLDALERESATLASVARSGDEPAMRKQFEVTRSTCKACHDEYKAD